MNVTKVQQPLHELSRIRSFPFRLGTESIISVVGATSTRGNSMRFSSIVLRSLLLGSTAALATPLWAQTQPEEQAQAQTPAHPSAATPKSEEEILVTATKRSSRVQDVPFSINAQTQKDIQRANASTIEDISRNVAGLTVQNLGPGQSQVSIRGVTAGQIVRDQPGVKEQVGIYLDESVVSLSLFTPD